MRTPPTRDEHVDMVQDDMMQDDMMQAATTYTR